MSKLKWKYGKKENHWWNNYYEINKNNMGYLLQRNCFTPIARFNKLSSAKKVAELIIFG